MNNPTAQHDNQHPRGLLGRLASLIRRLWALAILVVVLFTGYWAVAYLVDFVFTPTRTPMKILEWQGTLDADALRSEEVLGITQSAPRAPVGHFHMVQRWYQPAPQISCTVSGCHHPLPHQANKATRSFANMHTSFMTCRMCHLEGLYDSLDAQWLDSTSLAPLADPPALMQLSNLLRSVDKVNELAGKHKRVLALMEQTLKTLGKAPVLEHLYRRINTSLPDSPVWRQAMHDLKLELPNHVRGEYGARLAPRQGKTTALETYRAIRVKAAAYQGLSQTDPQRKKLHQEIHADVQAQPRMCLSCHSPEPALNYQALGYRADKAEALSHSDIARMIEKLQQGSNFHLPTFLTPQWSE